MNRRLGSVVLMALVMLWAGSLWAQSLRRDTDPPLKCTKCHSNTVQWKEWTSSIHARVGLTCTDCHKGAEKSNHSAKSVKTASCTDCHYWWKGKAKDFSGSTHAKAGLRCASCHNPHRDQTMVPKEGQWASRCSRCHKGGPQQWHAYFPEVKRHLAENSCIVCHEDVHKIGKTGMATVTCSSCHPKGSGLIAKVADKHTFLPHENRHLSKLACEDCHRPKKPTKTCTDCHSSRTILERGRASSEFTDPYTQKKYGYVIGATHLKWLDILGLLLFAGAAAVWIFHGGLRIIIGSTINKRRGS